MRAGLLSARQRRALQTQDGLQVVRMSQDSTYHLAAPEAVGAWQTTALCGAQIMAEVEVYHPSEVVEVPVYRGRNEFSKCPRCDATVRETENR